LLTLGFVKPRKRRANQLRLRIIGGNSVADPVEQFVFAVLGI
jgi:hypothetical protein